MKPIDLRSDTVTTPTPEMRKAMAEAEVGDDVYGEDPTVNRLEARAAEMLGMEAALFVPSGTMGNAIAVRILTRRGDEVLVERRSHVVRYELSGMSVLSGVMPRMADAPGGHLTPEHVRAAVAPRAYYKSDVGLVVLENTHNLGGGTVQRVEEVRSRRRRRARVRLPRPRGRGADLERGGRAGRLARGARRGRGHRHGLPVQGPVRPGRLRPGLLARAHRGSEGRAQAPGRRDAPGRRARRRRARGARHDGRAPRRRPRERQAPGGRARPGTRRRRLPGRDEHGRRGPRGPHGAGRRRCPCEAKASWPPPWTGRRCGW